MVDWTWLSIEAETQWIEAALDAMRKRHVFDWISTHGPVGD